MSDLREAIDVFGCCERCGQVRGDDTYEDLCADCGKELEEYRQEEALEELCDYVPTPEMLRDAAICWCGHPFRDHFSGIGDCSHYRCSCTTPTVERPSDDALRAAIRKVWRSDDLDRLSDDSVVERFARAVEALAGSRNPMHDNADDGKPGEALVVQATQAARAAYDAEDTALGADAPALSAAVRAVLAVGAPQIRADERERIKAIVGPAFEKAAVSDHNTKENSMSSSSIHYALGERGRATAELTPGDLTSMAPAPVARRAMRATYLRILADVEDEAVARWKLYWWGVELAQKWGYLR